MQSKVLRLLTFVCFFQFSGINNGYTILITASPLNARESASCLTQTIKDINSTIRSGSGLSLMEVGHGWVVSFSLKSQIAILGLFQFEREIGQENNKENASRPQTGYQSHFEVRPISSLINKASYLKIGKESWSKRERFSFDYDLTILEQFTLSATANSGVMIADGGGEQFDLWRKRFLTRRLGSGLNADADGKFKITKELV